MDERTPDPADPADDHLLDDDHEPREEYVEQEYVAEEEPVKPYANAGPGRRALWVVGGGVGAYMIVRGLYGVITGEDAGP